MIDGMALLEAGVPYALAFGADATTRSLSAARRLAMHVVIGERRGGTYDWKARQWVTAPAPNGRMF